MKKRLKIVGILILTVLIAVWVRYGIRYIATENADVIVRVSYTGLENLFHARYEYYTVGSGRSYRVSKDMVEKKLGKIRNNAVSMITAKMPIGGWSYVIQKIAILIAMMNYILKPLLVIATDFFMKIGYVTGIYQIRPL